MKNCIEKLNKKVENLAIMTDISIRKGANMLKKPLNNDGWGKDEIIAIAATLIIAAFVMIPGLNEIAKNVVAAAKTWFSGTMSSKIFLESPIP